MSASTDLSATLEPEEFVCAQLAEYVDTEDLADVVFVCGTQKTRVYGHRFIIAVRSSYFRQVLYEPTKPVGAKTTGARDAKLREVVLPQVDTNAFREALRYMYTGRLRLTTENVGHVLEIATLYALDHLKILGCEYMRETLTIQNACVFFFNAIHYNVSSPLRQAFLEFIGTNAFDVMKTPAFEDLHGNALMEILQSDLMASDEIDIFRALLRWGKKRVAEGRGTLKLVTEPLVPYIRFRLMTAEELTGDVEPLGIVPDALLLESYKFLATKKGSARARAPRGRGGPSGGSPADNTVGQPHQHSQGTLSFFK